MKRIHEVILDLDDVLNTFCMAALYQVGVGPVTRDYACYPHQCGWDIVRAANVLGDEVWGDSFCPFTTEMFWESLSQQFWSGVPCVVYLNNLLEYLEDRVGRDNIIIATSPTLAPACVAGKLEWIQTFLPKWLHRQYMIGPCKDWLAGPNSLLIDDREENCKKFEAQGGHSLLVHKPWNHDPKVVWYRGQRQWVDWDALTLESLQAGLYRYFGKEFKV